LFARLTVLPSQSFEVTHPIFDKLQTRFFHHLMPKDNFRYQAPLKNAKFDVFGSENATWKIWL